LRGLLTIYAAVNRATLDGKNPNGWFPEQKLSVAEAVEAYTMGSAYAEFQENEKGSITPGKLADMVLLSDDIFTKEPGENPGCKSSKDDRWRENRMAIGSQQELVSAKNLWFRSGTNVGTTLESILLLHVGA
jgi:hypothetical protein